MTDSLSRLLSGAALVAALIAVVIAVSGANEPVELWPRVDPSANLIAAPAPRGIAASRSVADATPVVQINALSTGIPLEVKASGTGVASINRGGVGAMNALRIDAGNGTPGVRIVAAGAGTPDAPFQIVNPEGTVIAVIDEDGVFTAAGFATP